MAEQKVIPILKNKADIKVISPSLTPRLRWFFEKNRIKWTKRKFRISDLSKRKVIIAATNDPKLNKTISTRSKKKGYLVNVVDVPAECNFISPAIMKQDHIQVALSTGGASPALASAVRNKLMDVLGPEYGALSRLLKAARPKIKNMDKKQKALFFRNVLSPEFVKKLKVKEK